jgi:cysteine-S-conjugate beta-lyase
MAKSKRDLKALKPETRIVAAAREYSEHGMVNPAVYRASTVLFPDVETIKSRKQDYVYGRRGTPTSRAFETAVAALEGGHAAKACPSGMAAISTALLAFLKSGDHLLIVDTAYHPARLFCDSILTKLAVEVTYYDPLIGNGIAALMKDNTRVIYCESPGSQTMEVQDIPAIAEAAHKKGAVVMLDNTWSGGHYFNAFAHGCDISIPTPCSAPSPATKPLGRSLRTLMKHSVSSPALMICTWVCGVYEPSMCAWNGIRKML